MPRLAERFIGIALIIGALAGLVLNATALYFLPQVQDSAQLWARDTLTVLNGTLLTTEDALDVTVASLGEAESTMDTVEATTRQVSAAIDDTVPLVEAIAEVTGTELPASINATQAALEAAGAGADAIESVLMAFSATLSILGGAPVYKPEEPISATLTVIGDSLEPLVESMAEMEATIETTGENLEEIQRSVDLLADNLSKMIGPINDAEAVTLEYRSVVSDQRAIVEDLEENSATWVVWAGRFVAALLIWLAIAQLGLLSQGIEMVLRSRVRVT